MTQAGSTHSTTLRKQGEVRTLRPAPRKPLPPVIRMHNMHDILQQQARVRRIVRATRVAMLWPSYVWR